MKFKSIILLNILLLPFIFFSCEEYKEPLNNTIKPGYIYCSDGSIVLPNKLDKTKTPIGVVFWSNTENKPEIDAKAYAVGLRDIPPTQWSDIPVHIENVSTNIDKFDGFANTVAMLTFDQIDTITNVYSSRLVWNYMLNTNWFIPSVKQLQQLYLSKYDVNKSLKLVGDELNNWYWSSTQDGTSEETAVIYSYIVSVSNGTINQSAKTNKYPIRPIITIK